MTYHRYNTSTESADNGCGYMMFARNQDSVRHYGESHWTFDGTGAIEIEELIEAAREAGFEDEFYDAEALNPSNIVNSAEAWDDMDAVMWIWDNVCDRRDWLAVKTDDGAIIFDPALAQLTQEED